MQYLLVKHRVADYAKWQNVFDSHAEAQRESGLRIVHVLREIADPNMLVLFFEVHDLEQAKAFTQAPSASQGADASGVIGVPEIIYLSE